MNIRIVAGYFTPSIRDVWKVQETIFLKVVSCNSFLDLFMRIYSYCLLPIAQRMGRASLFFAAQQRSHKPKIAQSQVHIAIAHHLAKPTAYRGAHQ